MCVEKGRPSMPAFLCSIQCTFWVVSGLPPRQGKLFPLSQEDPLQSQFGYSDLFCFNQWVKSKQLGTALGCLGVKIQVLDHGPAFRLPPDCPQSFPSTQSSTCRLLSAILKGILFYTAENTVTILIALEIIIQ